MKKNILILIIMILIFTGCNKDEMSKVNNDDKVKVQDNVINDNKVQNITDNEEKVLDDNINEPIVEPLEEVTTTTTTITKKVTTRKTTKKTTKKITTSKVTTTVKSETTTKKAENKIILKRPIESGYAYYLNNNVNVINFKSSYNTPIYPIANGKVTNISNNSYPCGNKKCYSKNITIMHVFNNTKIYSKYSDVFNSILILDDVVSVNTAIGYIGKIDVITAFRFSMNNEGGSVDPRNYIELDFDDNNGFSFTSR